MRRSSEAFWRAGTAYKTSMNKKLSLSDLGVGCLSKKRQLWCCLLTAPASMENVKREDFVAANARWGFIELRLTASHAYRQQHIAMKSAWCSSFHFKRSWRLWSGLKKILAGLSMVWVVTHCKILVGLQSCQFQGNISWSCRIWVTLCRFFPQRWT